MREKALIEQASAAYEAKMVPAESAADFLKLFESNPIKPARQNSLMKRPGYCRELTQDKVWLHPFFLSLVEKRKFQKAIQYLSEKDLVGDCLAEIEVDVAKIMAIIAQEHCLYTNFPNLLKGTAEAKSSKSLLNINSLLSLLESELQMEQFTDTEALKGLLIKLKNELTGEIPATYSRSKRGDILRLL